MKNLSKKIAEMDEMVMAIVGISSENLYQVKFDFAISYLEQVIGTDTFGLAELPKTKEFWAHWKHLWYRLDQELFMGSVESESVFRLDENSGDWWVKTSFGGVMISDMITAYIHQHEMQNFKAQLNSALIEESWHQTIKNLGNKNHINRTV